jgi:hypothetical protein
MRPALLPFTVPSTSSRSPRARARRVLRVGLDRLLFCRDAEMRAPAGVLAAAAALLLGPRVHAADPGRIGYIMSLTRVVNGRYCADFSPYVREFTVVRRSRSRVSAAVAHHLSKSPSRLPAPRRGLRAHQRRQHPAGRGGHRAAARELDGVWADLVHSDLRLERRQLRRGAAVGC